MKKLSLPCLLKNAFRGGSAIKPVSSDKGWTGCAVKPIEHVVSLEQLSELKLAQRSTLQQVLQTSSQSAVQCDMAAKSGRAAKEWSALEKEPPEAVT